MSQWDQHADLYHQGIGEEGDELHKLIDPHIFKALGDLKSKIVLDAGCGNGYLSRQLAPKAKKVHAIDSSPKLLALAKSQPSPAPIAYQQVDLGSTLPFVSSEFDTIIAHMVLQYLPTLTTTAQEFARILKPKGQLILSVDHPAHALFYRAQELVGTKNPKFLSSGNYFEERKHSKKSLWGKAVLTYYHRPVMAYFKPFQAAGFNLTDMEELREDKHPEVPRILFLVFTKETGHDKPN